jgi:hypothetical protein
VFELKLSAHEVVVLQKILNGTSISEAIEMTVPGEWDFVRRDAWFRRLVEKITSL